MTDDAARLARHVDAWHGACRDFVALARTLDEQQGDLPTDLAGWSVRDNVAHTAHLEAVLAGAPEETIDVPDAPHVTGLMGHYTEQGVLARRERSLAQLLDELEDAVARRYEVLRREPPSDPSATPPRTPGGVPWDTGTLLSNRPVDVWMHEQDVRRAIGRPGNLDSPAARHTIGVFGRALPMVLGKRVAAPVGTSVRVEVPEAGRSWTVAVGEDGRAAFDEETTEPTAQVTLGSEDFIVLAGGRRPVARTNPEVTGDRELATRFLEAMALTP
ncbi:MAG TPA: maleylpyruvate isomerase family mycothiol-dependent enzyme [Marmoricola sp.]|jgi:uncharacterized protein (TIGR03083 family)|nr:maleylpyruvate isomerase family mycothiol-dependent enzyme [Marmoricola sp.]